MFFSEECNTDGTTTRLLVTNQGVAPLYRDAWFAIGEVRADKSLKGLLPNTETWVEIPAVPKEDGSDIHIISDHILPKQEIEFNADIESETSLQSVQSTSTPTSYYNLAGQAISQPTHGIYVKCTKDKGQKARSKGQVYKI